MRLNASPAWKYFRKLSPVEAECQVCEVVIPIKQGSTSRLLSHIKLRHSDNLEKENNEPDTERDPIVIPFSRKEPVVEHHNVASVVPGENILRCLASYWTSGPETSHDVVIYCQDGHLPAHKLVLASVSNFLYQEFADNNLETASVFLPDFLQDQVRDFLVDVYDCVSLSRHVAITSVLGIERRDLNEGETHVKREENTEKIEGKSREVPFKKERKNKSFVWNYFSVEGEFALCNYCDIKMARTNTCNMADHVIANHMKEVKIEHLPKKFKSMLIVKDDKESNADNERAEEGLESSQFTRISEDGFLCMICMKNFSSRTSCLNHWKSVHSGLSPFKCEICEKNFTRKDTYQCHMQSHENLKEFMCSECGKRFNRKRVRDYHERSHLKDYKKICKFCGKKFLRNCQLRRHERIHTGEKPFQCEQCSRRFRQSHQLTTHMRVHTGERPYQCSLCLAWFKHYSSRNNHKCNPDTAQSDVALIGN